MTPKVVNKFNLFKVFLLLFILADSCYAFYQYYHLPLDGDLVPIVAPSEHYASVLNDPFGISVITDHKEYAATNRYFAHITMVGFYKSFYQFIAPLFNNKVTALYGISALFSIAVHLLMLFLLAVYICGHFKFWKTSFLLATGILVPFFQINGYYDSIGIIDKSVTYTFFYALPMALLLLFFLPFYLSYYHRKPIASYFKKWMWPLWILLSIYICFSGSQMAPLVIIICPTVVLIHFYFKSKSFIKGNSSALLFFFGFVLLLSVYSFYIGRFNSENGTPIPLMERYWKLAKGLPKFLTYKMAFAFMAILLLVNLVLLKKLKANLFKSNIFKLIVIALLLCAAFLILLPLGGYRPYRPWIVRYDTFLPITIVLIFLLSFSSHFLLTSGKLTQPIRSYYTIFLISILFVFQSSDCLPLKNDNSCQKEALSAIAASNESVIELSNDCTLLSWFIISDPAYSKDIGKMLHFWGISRQEIIFYQTDKN